MDTVKVQYLKLESDDEEDLDLEVDSPKKIFGFSKNSHKLCACIGIGIVISAVVIYFQVLPMLHIIQTSSNFQQDFPIEPTTYSNDDIDYDPKSENQDISWDDDDWWASGSEEVTTISDEGPLGLPDEDSLYYYDTLIDPTTTTTTFSPLILKVNASEFYKVNSTVTKRTADYMLANMNTSVDPCDNFYEFACQRWIEKHPTTVETGWDVPTDLENKTNRIYTSILEKPVQTNNLLAVQQAKNHYKLCLEYETVSRKYGSYKKINDTLLSLDFYGGWPILYEKGKWQTDYFNNWKTMLAKLAKRRLLHNTPLLSINDYSFDPNRSYIHISPPTTFFGKNTTGMTDAEVEDAIVDFVGSVLKYVERTQNFSETYVRLQAKSIVKIGRQLSQFVNTTWTEDMKRTTGFEYAFAEMQFDKLMSLFDKIVGHDARVQFEDIVSEYSFIDDWLDDLGRTVIYSVFDIPYLLKAINLTTTLSDKELANYFLFVMFSDQIVPVNKNLRRLQASRTNELATTKSVSESCTASVLERFKYALEHEFAKEVFQSESQYQRIRDQVEYMFWRTLKALGKLLLRSNMRNNTSIFSKLYDTRICFGFSDWIFNETRVQEKYEGLILSQATYDEQVNSYRNWSWYKPSSNEDDELNCPWYSEQQSGVGAFSNPLEFRVFIPAGILQPPFFELDRPMSINYGSMGTILGHEITHIFSKLDWEADSYDFLEKPGFCLSDQYDKFSVSSISGNHTLNGRQTVDENFSDNGGLQEAFTAYKEEYSQIMNQTSPRFGLDIYSDDQLFFLAFAQNWCQSISNPDLISFMNTYIHSPDVFRVLGSLQNSLDFAKAWNCPAGSKMNPVEKCNLFE